MQKFVDEHDFNSRGIRDDEERTQMEERVADFKKKIVNLSSTTRLLSPLTAFIGVRKDGPGKVSCKVKN